MLLETYVRTIGGKKCALPLKMFKPPLNHFSRLGSWIYLLIFLTK